MNAVGSFPVEMPRCVFLRACQRQVADFGTGRIASIQETHRDVAPTSNGDSACQNPSWTNLTDNDRSGCTLSKGVGTLLWMAPEVLRGSKVREGQAPAMDVYSYAIVLWEIW
jgi:serine/threonine protein kinase